VKDGDFYRVADATETEYVDIEAGEVMIKGLDTDTYYLEEIEAPAGYNMLTARVAVTPDVEAVEAVVVNSIGTELPSTGGIGTTIFYALGAVMVIGAGVLLVAKKRMSVEG
ncbi:MAG: LPXTG cell wall anchor domain-containing protein, partial [Clostridia bacterium]|nr:LPXTG cell wall anchor domain-containing protein [Clostridia bacterium]